MLPGSTPERIDREAARGRQSGRTQEIQRLIGRSLRAVTDLDSHGRGPDHPRLRRPPGRRRDPHGVHLRRLRRPPRRVHPPGRDGTSDRASAAATACAAVSVGVVDALADARPRLRRGQQGGGRHERGHDRAAAASSRSRAPPKGAPFSRGELDELLGAGRDTGSPTLLDLQAGALAEPPPPRPPLTGGCGSCWPPPTRTRPGRSTTSSAPRLDLECVPRPADVAEVDETGDTLEKNARLKARAVRDATGEAAIADDTGLEVDALDGEPGVRSAPLRRTRRDRRRQRDAAARPPRRRPARGPAGALRHRRRRRVPRRARARRRSAAPRG